MDLTKLSMTNAAGMVKLPHEAEPLLKGALTHITVGSLTKLDRPGSVGETYYYNPQSGASYNSKGLPGRSIDYSLGWLPEFRKKCHDAGKTLVVSFAAFSVLEAGELAERFAEVADEVEFNGGCGNVWKDGVQKPIPSYHPELLGESLRSIRRALGSKKVILKYSPVEDDHLLIGGAQVIMESGNVEKIIAVNTLPNQRGKREDGSDALAWSEVEGGEVKHTGGMGGKPLKPDGIRVLKALSHLPDSIGLIACGGIDEGQDLVDYYRAIPGRMVGWAAGTAFFERGPGVFSVIPAQAVDILERS